MKFTDFKTKFRDLPFIRTKDICWIAGEQEGKQVLFNQLYRWQQRKLVVKLKKGIYLLGLNERKIYPSRAFLANQLYHPSYVSLEYALNFYGLIPEKVVDMTSVTTKKTNTFKNSEGHFVYQHIKARAYDGFKSCKDEEGLTFFMAQPEKAMVDFLYLNLKRFDSEDKGVFEESYRFQNLEVLRKSKLLSYARLFEARKLTRLVRSLCDFIAHEVAQ